MNLQLIPQERMLQLACDRTRYSWMTHKRRHLRSTWTWIQMQHLLQLRCHLKKTHHQRDWLFTNKNKTKIPAPGGTAMTTCIRNERSVSCNTIWCSEVKMSTGQHGSQTLPSLAAVCMLSLSNNTLDQSRLLHLFRFLHVINYLSTICKVLHPYNIRRWWCWKVWVIPCVLQSQFTRQSL